MARLRNGFEATKRLVWVVHEDSQLLEMARSQILEREADIISTRRGNSLIRAVLPDYFPPNKGTEENNRLIKMCACVRALSETHGARTVAANA